MEQVQAALNIPTINHFLFYLSAIYFALGKTKEAILQLEKAMTKSPKTLKNLLN